MVSPKWETVADVRLAGEAFRDRGTAVRELQQLRRSVAETMAAYWLAGHPLPQGSLSHLQECMDIQILRVEKQETLASIRFSPTKAMEVGAGQVLEIGELREVLHMVWDGLKLAAQSSQPLHSLPMPLVALVAWGALLPDDGAVEISPTGGEPVRVTAPSFRQMYLTLVSGTIPAGHRGMAAPEGKSEEPSASNRPIEEILREIADEVADEEWNKLPTDLSLNLDHYLYGAPRK